MLRAPDASVLGLVLPWFFPACLLVQPLDEAVRDGDSGAGGQSFGGASGEKNGNSGNSGNSGTGGLPSTSIGGAPGGEGPGPGTGADSGAGASAGSGAMGAAGMGTLADPSWALWPMPNPASTGLPNPHSYTRSTPVALETLVRDEVTGLVWEQHDNGTYASRTAEGAEPYCTALSWGGETDWRLPTAIELFSIVDFTRGTPAIDPTAFPMTPTIARFWSSTLAAQAPGFTWFVSFDFGSLSYDIIPGTGDDGMGFVRCVLGVGAP